MSIIHDKLKGTDDVVPTQRKYSVPNNGRHASSTGNYITHYTATRWCGTSAAQGITSHTTQQQGGAARQQHRALHHTPHSNKVVRHASSTGHYITHHTATRWCTYTFVGSHRRSQTRKKVCSVFLRIEKHTIMRTVVHKLASIRTG